MILPVRAPFHETPGVYPGSTVDAQATTGEVAPTLEQMFLEIFEKGLVAGAFVYLLWVQTTNYSKTLDKLSDSMANQADTLAKTCVAMSDISETLRLLNTRMESLERRIERIEYFEEMESMQEQGRFKK